MAIVELRNVIEIRVTSTGDVRVTSTGDIRTLGLEIPALAKTVSDSNLILFKILATQQNAKTVTSILLNEIFSLNTQQSSKAISDSNLILFKILATQQNAKTVSNYNILYTCILFTCNLYAISSYMGFLVTHILGVINSPTLYSESILRTIQTESILRTIQRK